MRHQSASENIVSLGLRVAFNFNLIMYRVLDGGGLQRINVRRVCCTPILKQHVRVRGLSSFVKTSSSSHVGLIDDGVHGPDTLPSSIL